MNGDQSLEPKRLPAPLNQTRGALPIRQQLRRPWRRLERSTRVNGSNELFGLAGISVTGLVVIAILAFLSVWSLGISMERLFVLARARRQSAIPC